MTFVLVLVGLYLIASCIGMSLIAKDDDIDFYVFIFGIFTFPIIVLSEVIDDVKKRRKK